MKISREKKERVSDQCLHFVMRRSAGWLDNFSKWWRSLHSPLIVTSPINVLPHEVLAKTTRSNCAILWPL